jgi:hypothetical protein
MEDKGVETCLAKGVSHHCENNIYSHIWLIFIHTTISEVNPLTALLVNPVPWQNAIQRSDSLG